MPTNLKLSIGAGVVVVLVGAIALFVTQNKQELEQPIAQDSRAALQSDSSEGESEIQEGAEVEEGSRMETEAGSASASGYTGYSADKLTGDRNLIFFAASWCPSCRDLDESLTSADEAGAIPDDLLILKADFDAEVALRQKYGVTIQHTLVQVDRNGELIQSWNGLYQTFTLSQILDKLV